MFIYIHIFCDMYRCNDIYVRICKDVSIYIDIHSMSLS